MADKWELVDFELLKYKSTESYILINFEFIENILDQHLSDTQTLMVNPFKGPFNEQIENWF